MTQPAVVLRSRLDQAIARYDRAAAVGVVLDAVRTGDVGLDAVYTDVLTPLLVDIGSGWQAGTTAVWEEHLASSVVRTVIESLAGEVAAVVARTPSTGHTIVLACPSGEQHDLGLRMLADRLALRGHTTYFLGADTPVEELVAAARALDADIVALSVATHYNLVLLRTFVDTLKASLPGARVGVGGPAFSCARDWPAEDLLVTHELGLDDDPSGLCGLVGSDG